MSVIAEMWGARMSDAKIRKSIASIWPEHMGGLIDLLIESRRLFGGDLEMFLVFCVIGGGVGPGIREAFEASGVNRPSGAVSTGDMRPTNAYSLAHFTGIPRETVRRKVDKLVRKGWVCKGEDGLLTPSPAAGDELREMADVMLRYLGRIERVIAPQR